MKTLIIIPAYNEENSIQSVVQEIQRTVPTVDVLVINDCSTDRTLQRCKSTGIPVLSLPVNLGIGGVVQTGYLYAVENKYDIAVQMDGDGQHNPQMLAALLVPIFSGDADMVIGSRFLSDREKSGNALHLKNRWRKEMPEASFKSTAMRRMGIRFFERWIHVLSGRRITDATSGFRACNRVAMNLFTLDYAKDYPEPEAVMTALRNGLRVVEVPVSMRERQAGVSSIGRLKSIYYMFKVSLAVLVSATKPLHGSRLFGHLEATQGEKGML